MPAGCARFLASECVGPVGEASSTAGGDGVGGAWRLMYALQRSVDAHSAELQRAASLESLLKQLQLSAGDSLHELFAPGRRLRHSGRGSIVKHYGGYDVRSYGAAGSGAGSNGGGGDDSQLCLLFSDCLIHIERRADAGGGRKAPRAWQVVFRIHLGDMQDVRRVDSASAGGGGK